MSTIKALAVLVLPNVKSNIHTLVTQLTLLSELMPPSQTKDLDCIHLLTPSALKKFTAYPWVNDEELGRSS